ncbi:MAG: hypothetical protein FJ245_14130 [Nitrospira sp.]|nr:hypothetical protein [Nitrospira sp.]
MLPLIAQGRPRLTAALFVLAGLWPILFFPTAGGAGALLNDPKGFRNIPWGSPLVNQAELALVQTMDRVKGYEVSKEPPHLGDTTVESVRLFTIDGQFGRVTIHYQGKETHDAVLAYLQSQFGPIDRSPGSMMRGLNQQYNWRGADTEINLTYEAKRERGYLFIESRTLSPRFNDALADTGSSY